MNRYRSRSRGFTLMELMVVILLISILSAVLVPEMRGTFEEALLRSSARQLVGACGVAYGRAVAEGRPHRLRFDPATGKFKVGRSSADGAGTPSNVDLSGGTGSIDPRVSVQLRPGANVSPAAVETISRRLVFSSKEPMITVVTLPLFPLVAMDWLGVTRMGTGK